MEFVVTPSAVATADEVLPLAQGMADGDAAMVERSADHQVSCTAGCSACCSQAVPVSAAEVRAIHAYIAELPADQAASIRRRIEEAADRLDEAQLSADGAHPADGANAARTTFSRRYFDAAVPCPLLTAAGTCGVRPVRPLACREYLVSSDPVHCATMDRERVVRLRVRRDLVVGFRSVSTLFGEPEIGILAFVLAEPAPPAPESSPRSGPRVMQVLTSAPTNPAIR